MTKLFVLISRSGGSKRDKTKLINRSVLDRFTKTRQSNGIVHDIDIRRWAREKGQEV